MGAHVTHRLAAFFLFQTIKIDVTVQMISLVLQHAAHDAMTFQHYRLAVQINAPHASIIGATSLVPQSWNGKAAFIAILLSAGLLQHRVKHIADFAVDIVGKRTQTHTDLVGGQPGASRVINGIQQILHQMAHRGRDLLDGIGQNSNGTARRCNCFEMTLSDLKDTLRAAAMSAGACAAGFARCEPVDAAVCRSYESWIGEGCHGSMAYLERYPDVRRDPALLLPGARTVMVCAFPYYDSDECAGLKLARYARGDDYHEVLRSRLQSVAEILDTEGYGHRICVDTAPLFERYWARQAGVGFTGRNRLLIVPGWGSYVFLAEILTDVEIAPDEPMERQCDGCGRCVAACPGGALRAASGFDARRCLSYLTIEHRGDLPAEVGGRPLGTLMGDCVYGCDVCQQVCPHNVGVPETALEEFRMRPALRCLSRADILQMDQPTFSANFRHSAVKRVKLAGLHRNASVLPSGLL